MNINSILLYTIIGLILLFAFYLTRYTNERRRRIDLEYRLNSRITGELTDEEIEIRKQMIRNERKAKRKI